MMPDIERFAELRELVFGDNALTNGELRYIKTLLSHVHTVDTVGELPVEIVALVAVHLQLKDFARCLRVSKAWRHLFLSDAVMAAYARHMWPALIPGVVNRSDFLSAFSRLGHSLYGFQDSAEVACTELVRWDNKSHYKLDPEAHENNDYPCMIYTSRHDWSDDFARGTARYAFGKVAWNASPFLSAVVVDDLRLKTRKLLTPFNGIMYGSRFDLRAFGSRLLVATVDRLLIAWDHVDNRRHEKWLPYLAHKCVTQDNKVAVVLGGGNILLWSPGHEMMELNSSQLLPKPTTASRVSQICKEAFFDPRKDKTLYLAIGYFTSPLSRGPASHRHVASSEVVFNAVVHEYLAANHVASWSAHYLITAPLHRASCNPVVPSARFEADEVSRISITEYEYTHSCILFRMVGQRPGSGLVVAFDKMKRKFMKFDQSFPEDWGQLCDGTYAMTKAGDFLLPYEPHWWKLFDLDFMVHLKGAPEGYKVFRSRYTPDTIAENVVQDITDDKGVDDPTDDHTAQGTTDVNGLGDSTDHHGTKETR